MEREKWRHSQWRRSESHGGIAEARRRSQRPRRWLDCAAKGDPPWKDRSVGAVVAAGGSAGLQGQPRCCCWLPLEERRATEGAVGLVPHTAKEGESWCVRTANRGDPGAAAPGQGAADLGAAALPGRSLTTAVGGGCCRFRAGSAQIRGGKKQAGCAVPRRRSDRLPETHAELVGEAKEAGGFLLDAAFPLLLQQRCGCCC